MRNKKEYYQVPIANSLVYECTSLCLTLKKKRKSKFRRFEIFDGKIFKKMKIWD